MHLPKFCLKIAMLSANQEPYALSIITATQGMTRRTKIVSKEEEMVTIKLWCALTTPEIFQHYQDILLSIFR
ncbi:IS1 transposase [Candidatus Cyrtobacter comes]|uniref:IS1 transposase n=1 Tax=Candidatus Cyrtobacter comes TaxID=675776 RepID=A0ABU5L926_9RICK|nr:IS1 transposase [Candidatus Cyrtobacter comes]